MAVIDFPNRSPSPEEIPFDTATELATIHSHPRFNGGVLLEPLPDYDSVVTDIEPVKNGTTHHEGIGTTYLERWEMSDDNSFLVLRGDPKKRLTDVPVVKDLAWGTQPLGFNLDIALRFMQQGWPIIIKGPELGEAIPLSHSAHNTHEVLDVTDFRGFSEPGMATVEGYSRGAMIGFGTLAYASMYKRKVLYASLEDPCIAKKLEVSLESAKKLVEHGPTELLTLGYQVGRLLLRPKKAWHYRGSVNLSTDGIRQLYRTGDGVFSGEAGELARHFPDKGQATVGFLKNSMANDLELYGEILAGKTGITFLRPSDRGGHLVGMDERLIKQIIRPFAGLIDQLREGAQPDEIDYSQVHKQSAA